MERTVDKRNIQVGQSVDNVVAVVRGADAERRRNDNSVHDAGRHRLIALGLAAADGPHRDIGDAEFFHQ